ncbi:MAG: NUDIX domain-containing protein [Planctomycetota bacterium]
MDEATSHLPRAVRVGSYALITQTDEILLCRLSARVTGNAGKWTLPGGGLDFGEHPEAAMIREVREETGLTVVSAELAGVDSICGPKGAQLYHRVRVIYRATVLGGDLTHEADGSTDECRWWRRDEIDTAVLVELADLGVRMAFGSDDG